MVIEPVCPRYPFSYQMGCLSVSWLSFFFMESYLQETQCTAERIRDISNDGGCISMDDPCFCIVQAKQIPNCTCPFVLRLTFLIVLLLLFRSGVALLSYAEAGVASFSVS
ncbi:hypothetical protein TNCT_421811 [Trichonephila clavata]|uniref:Uncharacterized protein n=1 Tax=Trichonephila clavata TaxID=2740835 RepID=A0A8X6HE22_TRICU|nr:hypothetical protein TNCT_421811 [Trichonephila clavata]